MRTKYASRANMHAHGKQILSDLPRAILYNLLVSNLSKTLCRHKEKMRDLEQVNVVLRDRWCYLVLELYSFCDAFSLFLRHKKVVSTDSGGLPNFSPKMSSFYSMNSLAVHPRFHFYYRLVIFICTSAFSAWWRKWQVCGEKSVKDRERTCFVWKINSSD